MRPISVLSGAVGKMTSLVYAAVFAITIYDVGLRYFLNSPTIWGLELVISLAGVHYVLGGAQAIRDDAHVRIDVIYQLFPPRLQRFFDAISYIVMIGFLAVLLYYSALQAQFSWGRGETSGAGWNSHAPMIMKFMIPVGAALMLAQSVEGLFFKLFGERSDVG